MVELFGIVIQDELLFPIATIIIGFVVLLAIIYIAYFILKKRKTKEEKHAEEIAKKVIALHEGKTTIKPKTQKQVSAVEKKLEIKKEEVTLKSLLIKKFKPKIVEQLGSNVEILDFNAKEENFLVLVEIAGAKLLLKLDSSGKILDYERPKKKK